MAVAGTTINEPNLILWDKSGKIFAQSYHAYDHGGLCIAAVQNHCICMCSII